MELTITYYAATLAAPTNNPTAPADGFVDDVRAEVYLAQNYPSDFTFALAQAKRRANKRFLNIIVHLQLMANIYLVSTETPGAAADTPPSSYSMLLQVERGDEVLQTPDELNPGQVLTGAAAIQRCIARGIMTTQSYNADVINPTKATTIGVEGSNLWNRYTTQTITLQVTPYMDTLADAQASVTVVPVTF